MALVSMRELLDHAATHNYAIPAFNVNNLEQVQAIMEAAAGAESDMVYAWIYQGGVTQGTGQGGVDDIPVSKGGEFRQLLYDLRHAARVLGEGLGWGRVLRRRCLRRPRGRGAHNAPPGPAVRLRSRACQGSGPRPVLWHALGAFQQYAM